MSSQLSTLFRKKQRAGQTPSCLPSVLYRGLPATHREALPGSLSPLPGYPSVEPHGRSMPMLVLTSTRSETPDRVHGRPAPRTSMTGVKNSALGLRGPPAQQARQGAEKGQEPTSPAIHVVPLSRSARDRFSM